MVQALRATVGNDLLNEIQGLVRADNYEPFTIKRIAKEAEKLSQVDVVAASYVRFALAALQWDHAGARYWINNALRNDSSCTTLMNGAFALSLLNQRREAADLARQVIDLAPQNADFMLQASGNLADVGCISEAIAALARLHEPSQRIVDYRDSLIKMKAALKTVGSSESRLGIEAGYAYAVLFEHKVRLREIRSEVDVDPDGGQSCLVHQLTFHGDLHSEMELEAALAQKLMDDPDWDPLRLSVEFAHENALQSA